MRIDGESVSVEVKKKIYNDVFKRHKRVTGKRVKDYLVREGIITKEQELSGFDQNFKSSLKAYMDIKQITTGILLSEQQQEDIILPCPGSGSSGDFSGGCFWPWGSPPQRSVFWGGSCFFRRICSHPGGRISPTGGTGGPGRRRPFSRFC